MHVYLSCDGYSDQFGGNNEEAKEQQASKKFMSKNFKKLLADINNTERTSQNLETQCSTLEQVMEKWKGNEP